MAATYDGLVRIVLDDGEGSGTNERGKPQNQVVGLRRRFSSGGNDARLRDHRCARGGEGWAVRLFEDLQPRLLRLRSRAHETADDIAGEVWEAIARGIGTFEGDEAGFRAWAFTIARRRVIEDLRRSTRRNTDPTAEEYFAALPGQSLVDIEAIDRMSAQRRSHS